MLAHKAMLGEMQQMLASEAWEIQTTASLQSLDSDTLVLIAKYLGDAQPRSVGALAQTCSAVYVACGLVSGGVTGVVDIARSHVRQQWWCACRMAKLISYRQTLQILRAWHSLVHGIVCFRSLAYTVMERHRRVVFR